jgi:hypothetical protein
MSADTRIPAESGGHLAVRKDDKDRDVIVAVKCDINGLKPGFRWATEADTSKKGG